VACGFAMHGAPAYLGEMSPPHLRGRMVAMKEAVIVLGILTGYAIGYALQRKERGWSLMYAVAAIPSVGLLAGAQFVLPPSARWLVLKGKPEEALHSLLFVMKNHSEAQSVLKDMQAQVQAAQEMAGPSSQHSLWRLFFHPSHSAPTSHRPDHDYAAADNWPAQCTLLRK